MNGKTQRIRVTVICITKKSFRSFLIQIRVFAGADGSRIYHHLFSGHLQIIQYFIYIRGFTTDNNKIPYRLTHIDNLVVGDLIRVAWIKKEEAAPFRKTAGFQRTQTDFMLIHAHIVFLPNV